jgi:hypothetical protein
VSCQFSPDTAGVSVKNVFALDDRMCNVEFMVGHKNAAPRVKRLISCQGYLCLEDIGIDDIVVESGDDPSGIASAVWPYMLIQRWDH